MPRLRATLPLLLLLAAASTVESAPPAPRPYSGCGVLVLNEAGEWGKGRLPLYREPGLLRVAEKGVSELPLLSGKGETVQLAATARKGGLTRVAYDDAGREGWLPPSRGAEYLSWQEFLPGRSVRLLPGMKKGLYTARVAPDEGAAAVATLPREKELRVLQVEEGWARLKAPAGWFRWRDGDGRLTIAIASR